MTQSVNDGQTVSYAYDNDGLLTQAGDLTATYDPQNGAITGTKIGNVTDSYGYTPFGEVKDYTASVSGVGVYSSSFTYDKLGRISTKTETVNGETHTYQYGYDSIGQLTDVWVDGSLKSHYEYDSNGNRVGGTYDNQDQMIKYGENTYQYSTNGELLEKVTPTGTTKYAYDVLGNLTAVTLEDGTKIEYVIDGANRRVGKKVNGVLVQGWLYLNGLKPIIEMDGNGNVVSRFIYGTNGITPDCMTKNGVEYRIISDQFGSVRMVVTVDSGQVVQQIDYDEWGNIVRDTNPGFQPFGFAGGMYDRDTKLTRFGARDYDAETGRWTKKDPIRFNGGDTDLYGYCGNDPINNLDPLGLVPPGQRAPQDHHFFTVRNKTFTPQLKKIFDKYHMNMRDKWNIERLPQNGAHAKEYNQYMLDRAIEADRAAEKAGGCPGVFRRMINAAIQHVMGNPEMLYKPYWNRLKALVQSRNEGAYGGMGEDELSRTVGGIEHPLPDTD